MLNRPILLIIIKLRFKRIRIRFISHSLHPDVCCTCDQLSPNPLWLPLLCRKWVWVYDRLDLCRPWSENQSCQWPVLPRCLTLKPVYTTQLVCLHRVNIHSAGCWQPVVSCKQGLSQQMSPVIKHVAGDTFVFQRQTYRLQHAWSLAASAERVCNLKLCKICRQVFRFQNMHKLECGPMPNVMVALPNTGGALCSTPQSLADAHYWSAVQ